MLERNRGFISTATIHRDIFFASGGFPDGMTCAEDWLMSRRVAQLTEWHSVEDRLAFVRRHYANNTSTNPTNDVVILTMLTELWRGECCAPHRPLRSYGSDYRFRVREGFRSGLRNGRPDLTLQCLRRGWELLPDRRNLIYAFTPDWLISAVRRSVR